MLIFSLQVTGDWLVIADVAVKSFTFRVVAVYTPNSAGCEPFLGDSKRIVLAGVWNAILNSKIDKAGKGASGFDGSESILVDFMISFNLVDRFRQDHPGKEMWRCIDSSPSVRIRSYLDRVSDKLTSILFLVPRSIG